ncbi:MAG: flagellar hook protein FlgE [Rhodoferax sp.]|uniref:flagellar hook protein FlgE n=1 Tax=Rhodoferax sp. TaxID=50421 RepID=UPI0014017711|nr:flagellar hook protein FlgE [Rhodoferax sp.]NDP39581.1 flagellar hook protein FlgE [Rhodoferax sp.]
MSFQTGLSGLAASSRNLDVIGNNIANANTVGMKASRAEFADVVASSLGVGGGTGAGIGVSVETVSQQFSQGSITVTGNNLDVAINGGGFFQLEMPDKTNAYTRAGQFKLDNVGNLVTNGGARVLGIKPDPVTGAILPGGKLEPLSLTSSEGIPAASTKTIKAELNLNAAADINNILSTPAGDPTASPPTLVPPLATYGTSVTAYDGQGIPIPVSLYFTKSDLNKWQVWTNDLTGTSVPAGSPTRLGADLEFDPATGSLFTGNAWENPVDISMASVNGSLATIPKLDLSKVSQFGAGFSVGSLSQDGHQPGKLVSINIDDKGVILGSYDNGVQVPTGQLKLATFANVQGLAPSGGNNWTATFASGAAVGGTPGSGQFGTARAGSLEDSNVDLTAELVNMMTAQRAYQANAQTIKTQDQVMSTLVNLR